MNKNQKLSLAIVADILGTSKKVVNSWSENKLKPIIDKKTGKKFFHLDELRSLPSASFLFDTKWDEEERIKEITENIVKQIPTLIDKKIDLFSSKVNQNLNGI